MLTIRMKQRKDVTISRLKPVITSNRYAYFRPDYNNVNLNLKSKVKRIIRKVQTNMIM